MKAQPSQIQKPFVSREKVIQQLRGWLKNVNDDNTPQFVLIEGDAGSGKTTLIEQFLKDISNEKMIVLQCKCSLEHQGDGHYQIMFLLNELIKSREKQPSDQKKWFDNLLSIGPDVLTVFSGFFPLLAVPAGITSMVLKFKDKKKENPEQIKIESLSYQFAKLVKHVAANSEVVLFIDDIHWADISTLRSILYLAQGALSSTKVLFLATYRKSEIKFSSRENQKEFEDLIAQLKRYFIHIIDLDNHGIDIQEYVDKRYHPNDFPKDFISRLQNKTGGHPFFIELLFDKWESDEIVKSDSDKGYFLAHEADLEKISLPDQFKDIIIQRLKNIPAEQKQIAETASVQGTQFISQAAFFPLDLEEKRGDELLNHLSKDYEIIVSQGYEQIKDRVLDIYLFSHPLIREILYQQLEPRQQREFHKAIAEFFDTQLSDKTPFYTQLAYHYSLACCDEKASGFALLAAQNEFSNYALDECQHWCNFGIKHCNKFWEGESQDNIKKELMVLSGKVYLLCGKYGEVEKIYRRLLDFNWINETPPLQKADFMANLAWALVFKTRTEEAEKLVNDALAILDNNKISFNHVSANLMFSLASVNDIRGCYEIELKYLDEIIDQSAKVEKPTTELKIIIADTWEQIANVSTYQGNYKEAVNSYKLAREIADEIGAVQKTIEIDANLASTYLEMGEIKKSEDLCKQALDIVLKIGDRDTEAYCYHTLAYSYTCGNTDLSFEDAKQFSLDSIKIYEQIDSDWDIHNVKSDLALVYIINSDLDQAYFYAEEGLNGQQDPDLKAYSQWCLAKVEAAKGNLDHAMELLVKASRRFRKSHSLYWLAGSLRDLGEICSKLKQKEKAYKNFKEAYSIYRKIGFDHEIRRTLNLANSQLDGQNIIS